MATVKRKAADHTVPVAKPAKVFKEPRTVCDCGEEVAARALGQHMKSTKCRNKRQLARVDNFWCRYCNKGFVHENGKFFCFDYI
jgi:hypothetical protein